MKHSLLAIAGFLAAFVATQIAPLDDVQLHPNSTAFAAPLAIDSAIHDCLAKNPSHFAVVN